MLQKGGFKKPKYFFNEVCNKKEEVYDQREAPVSASFEYS